MKPALPPASTQAPAGPSQVPSSMASEQATALGSNYAAGSLLLQYLSYRRGEKEQ